MSANAAPKRGFLGLRGEQRRDLRWALFFIAPWVIGFLIFTLGPMLASLYYSFTSFSTIKPPEWIGLANYQKLAGGDKSLSKAILNTLYMVILGIPIGQAFAFVTALLLNLKV